MLAEVTAQDPGAPSWPFLQVDAVIDWQFLGCLAIMLSGLQIPARHLHEPQHAITRHHQHLLTTCMVAHVLGTCLHPTAMRMLNLLFPSLLLAGRAAQHQQHWQAALGTITAGTLPDTTQGIDAGICGCACRQHGNSSRSRGSAARTAARACCASLLEQLSASP